MATSGGLPQQLRKHAERIPPAILAQMCQAEARVRCEHLHELAEHVSTAPAEVARHLAKVSGAIARSIPVCCYVDRRRTLRQQSAAADRRVQLDDHGKLWTLAGDFDKGRLELEEANRYSPGLESATDKAMLGKESTPEAAEIVNHHRSHHGR